MPPRRAPRLNNEAGGAGGELVRQRDAPRVSRTVQLLILVLLAAPTLVSTAQRVATNVGVDFYNVWGVSAALHAAGPALGDPWRNGDGYLAKVRELVAASGDPKLQQVATYWRVPDYTGSPLLYTIFGPMAGPYSGTLSTYQAVQVIAFVAACVLLAQLYGVDFFSASFIALISLIGYQPFVSDLRVANLGSVQFAVLAVMLACARALRTRHADTGGARAVALCAVVLAALVGLTLAKPNITLVTACIAVHLALRHGRRTFVPAALVAVGVGAALAILPCLYFGSWGVWHDWYSFVYGSNALMLVRNVDDGNYSTVAIAASALGAGVFATALAIGAALAASLTAALAVAARRRAEGWRAALARLRDRLGAEPELALAIGVAATMATSPLLWIHYYIVALIPCFWLLRTRAEAPLAGWLAAASVVLSSGIPGLLLTFAGWTGAGPAWTAISWIPLWAGVLVVLGRPEPAATTTPAGEELLAAG